MSARPDVRRPIGLGLVLACLAGTLAVGYATKAACVDAPWTGQQYTTRCYTDIIPLFATEQLEGDRLPYLDACAPTTFQCDEYPVVTMYAMRLAAWASSTYADFFRWNVVLLAIAALIATVALHAMVGERALYLALAPTLALHAFTNWDLLAVAGVGIGVGVATKLYPGLLLLPFLAQRWREGDRRGAGRMAAGAAGTWLALNVPFALLAGDGWSRFFRFNTTRTADWDSLWFIGCHQLTGNLGCTDTQLVNVASAVLFLVSVALVWWIKRRVDPDFARWTAAFPVLVLFLLSNKVYSPQYSLWLLPWFALALPDLLLFSLFAVTEVAVFFARFSWFVSYGGGDGVKIEAFEVAVLARTVVLIACLVAWVTTRTGREAEAA